MAQDIAARVRSFCLAPDTLLSLAYAWQMALRVVGPVGGHLNKRQLLYRCFVPMSAVKQASQLSWGGLGSFKMGFQEGSSDYPYRKNGFGLLM